MEHRVDRLMWWCHFARRCAEQKRGEKIASFQRVPIVHRPQEPRQSTDKENPEYPCEFVADTASCRRPLHDLHGSLPVAADIKSCRQVSGGSSISSEEQAFGTHLLRQDSPPTFNYEEFPETCVSNTRRSNQRCHRSACLLPYSENRFGSTPHVVSKASQFDCTEATSLNRCAEQASLAFSQNSPPALPPSSSRPLRQLPRARSASASEAPAFEAHVIRQSSARGLKKAEIHEMRVSNSRRDESSDAWLESSSNHRSPRVVIATAPRFDTVRLDSPSRCAEQAAPEPSKCSPPALLFSSSCPMQQLPRARSASASEAPAFEAHVIRQSSARGLKKTEIHEMRVSNTRRDESPDAWLESSSNHRSPRVVMPRAPRFDSVRLDSPNRCAEQKAPAHFEYSSLALPPSSSQLMQQLPRARSASASEAPAFETHVIRQSSARGLKKAEIHEMRVSNTRRDESPDAWLESSSNHRSPRVVIATAPRFDSVRLDSPSRCAEQAVSEPFQYFPPAVPPSSLHLMQQLPRARSASASEAPAFEAHVIRQSSARGLKKAEIHEMRVSNTRRDESPDAWLESSSNHRSPRVVIARAPRFDSVRLDSPSPRLEPLSCAPMVPGPSGVAHNAHGSKEWRSRAEAQLNDGIHQRLSERARDLVSYRGAFSSRILSGVNPHPANTFSCRNASNALRPVDGVTHPSCNFEQLVTNDPTIEPLLTRVTVLESSFESFWHTLDQLEGRLPNLISAS